MLVCNQENWSLDDVRNHPRLSANKHRETGVQTKGYLLLRSIFFPLCYSISQNISINNICKLMCVYTFCLFLRVLGACCRQRNIFFFFWNSHWQLFLFKKCISGIMSVQFLTQNHLEEYFVPLLIYYASWEGRHID